MFLLPRLERTARNRLQGQLMTLAVIFFLLGSIGLTISPAVRSRSWETQLIWDHWFGFLTWVAVFLFLHNASALKLPNRDPYLLPIGAFLAAWGLLTIFRLEASFGFRQTIWIWVVCALLGFGLNLSSDLEFLKRYKYLWLSGSLALTAITVFLGVNPMGYGPKMWLGCCGVYLQPSEPLKLLLIAYLAGYLADRYSFLALSTKPRFNEALGLLAPTLVMTALAMALLVIQRDLGTASLFLMFYAAVVFVATGRKRILISSALMVLVAGFIGYSLFEVVKIRVDAWINPWLDPSGGSYQIVQSLIAIANGGLVGRGPGLGYPGVVPLAHSDLIFAAIAEEYGLVGILGFLMLFALLAQRGLRAAILAKDNYRGYLAAGLTTYLVGQALLIIAGSMRLMPLTGITLPFVSYGGSSLVTAFIALLLLMHISADLKKKEDIKQKSTGLTTNNVHSQSSIILLGLLFIGLAVAALATGWWSGVRAPALLSRTDNPRRAITDRWVMRGALVDRNLVPINVSTGEPGSYQRQVLVPDLSNVVGYTHPVYGQAGLEADLDDYLRGEKGVSTLTAWWSHLVFGQPPPGLDIRLSLDLKIQEVADEQMKGYPGALVLMDAASGEILAMSSSPTFNANQLSDSWESLVSDPESPLLNRALQGRYPIGNLDTRLLTKSFPELDLDRQPEMYLDLGSPNQESIGYSPLQLAWISTLVSNRGEQPGPKIITGIRTEDGGWDVLSALESVRSVLTPSEVSRLVSHLEINQGSHWEIVQVVKSGNEPRVTWYVAGTVPEWDGRPMALAVLLEGNFPEAAQKIGLAILNSVIP